MTVEDWLAEKQAEVAKNQRQTLQWAIIAGLAAIAGVVVGIVGIAASFWLAK
jgi:hypothetical protein